MITQAFATFQSSSMIQVIEAVALLATELTMLEVFRRCLSRNKHFTAQLAVIVVMVLTFLIAAASNLPMFLCTPEEMSSGVSGVALSKFSTFSIACGLVLFLTNLFLCIQLMVKYAGRIRLYGASLHLTAFCAEQWLQQTNRKLIINKVVGPNCIFAPPLPHY